jgi:HEAT repeat protein
MRQTDLRTRGRRRTAPASRVAAAVWLFVALAVAGCSRWPLLSSPEPVVQTPRDSEKPVEKPPTAEGPPTAAAATPQAKIEALGAWQKGGQEALPADLSQLAGDPNARVRAAAVEAAAERRPPEAEKLVMSALEDQDLQVRLAAITALGALGGAQASAMLETFMQDRGELIRVAAFRALTRLGNEEVLARAQKDPSWRVRLVVAEALANHPDVGGGRRARDLLNDPSPAVQGAVVHSVGQWPLVRGGPILLAALASNTRTTRSAAAEQLAAAWPAAAEFPVDGKPAQRAQVLASLETAFRSQFPGDSATLAGAMQGARPARHVSAEEAAGAQRLIQELEASAVSTRAREETVRRLAAFGPGLVDVLEYLTAESRSPLPEAVYHDVLPQCVPEFASLDQMRSSDVAVRRRAAEDLVALSRRQTLGPLALSRLAVVAEKESDSVVWRSVLGAIARDASEPSIRLACVAASHPTPEIRRMGCEYLADHPATTHASILLPALNDSHREVVGAAVRALGAGGGLEDHQPLKRLLGSADESLRVEVATALARLGDPAGPAALERLAYSTDPVVRRQVAAAMGQVPDPAYKATLVRLLDDQYSIRLAAVDSLSKVAPGDDSGVENAEQGSVTERVARWKRAVRQ